MSRLTRSLLQAVHPITSQGEMNDTKKARLDRKS